MKEKTIHSIKVFYCSTSSITTYLIVDHDGSEARRVPRFIVNERQKLCARLTSRARELMTSVPEAVGGPAPRCGSRRLDYRNTERLVGTMR